MIDFNEEYILENNRIKLTPLKKNDFDNLVHFAVDEPELWTYSLLKASSAESLKVYIEKANQGRIAQNMYAFTVFDKQTNQYAGSTRFYDVQISNASLSIGYTWYGKKFQGTGLNQNCKYLLLAFAFEVMKMERVEFRTDLANKRSINAMKNIGCVVEGILRSNIAKPDGTRLDSIVLSILKEDWQKTVKQKLQTIINI